MKIKSLRLALYEGGNPEYPTGAGSSVNLWCGLDRRQGETTSAGDAPPVSATRERRARSIKIFGVGLQRQVPEVKLEQSQVEPRCLDHGGEPQRQVRGAVAAGALLGPEQGPQDRHVQPGPGPVHDPVEHPIHLRADGEQQVAAVLGLIDRVAVAEPGALLLVDVETEAQTRGVDPPITYLGQAPYRRGLRQGVCDVSQAGGVGDLGEAVALLDEPDPGRPRGGGDVLVIGAGSQLASYNVGDANARLRRLLEAIRTDL